MTAPEIWRERCVASYHEGDRERDAADVCGDGYCRDCHRSLSFEDCVSGRWFDEQRRRAGLPPIAGGTE